MAATEVNNSVAQNIRKGDKVIASHDLADGVKAGDRGRVMIVNGFEWVRYWVRFDGGQELSWLTDDDIERQKRGLLRR